MPAGATADLRKRWVAMRKDGRLPTDFEHANPEFFYVANFVERELRLMSAIDFDEILRYAGFKKNKKNNFVFSKVFRDSSSYPVPLLRDLNFDFCLFPRERPSSDRGVPPPVRGMAHWSNPRTPLFL